MQDIKDIILELNSEGKDWPDEKKCRIIYREVMRREKYDPMFSFIEEEEEKYYRYIKKLKSDNIENQYVTCNQVAISIKESLNNVGIEATIEGYESHIPKHVFVIANLKAAEIDGQSIPETKICLDTYKDLMTAKKGFRLKGYGISSESSDFYGYKGEYIPEISEHMKERAEQYDIERGYVYTAKFYENGKEELKPIYFDDVVEQIKKEINDEKNIRMFSEEIESKEGRHVKLSDIEKYKVHFLINYLKNNKDLDVKQVEWERFFSYIYKEILGIDRPIMRQYRLGNINRRDDVDMLLFIKYGSGDKEYYLYDENERGYVLKSKEAVKAHSEEKNINPLGYKGFDFFD